MSEFYKYFKENMDGLGLPAPESLFGSVQAAVANASVLLGLIEKFGKRVTIGELVGAGTRLEGLALASGCAAAFYVGAVIGSLAVATGRSLANGTSLSDVLVTASKHDLYRPWLIEIFCHWPGIYKPAVASRKSYRLYATMT
jgi:hypothetical protein